MESQIKNTFRSVFENFKDLEKCKELLREFNSDMKRGQKMDNDQISLLIHNVTKNFRAFYQEYLIKIFAAKENEYKEYGINLATLIDWMSEEEIIDYSSYLVIMEDVIETFPSKDLEQIFDVFEKNIKKKTYSNFTDNRKLTLLKVSNSILKRLSAGNDTKFRGRVQMLLASTFPVSEKSGVNQKGLYNSHHTGSQPKFDQEKTTVFNPRFYRQFWNVFKYLSNPFLLFSNLMSEDGEELQLLDDKMDSSQVVLLENDLNVPKLEIFLNNISKIISYFEQHQINMNDNSDTILSYPKYLTSQDLFELQLNDSSFRKTVLFQFFIVLKSFLRPISQSQKKAFVFSENEKKKINEILSSLKSIMNLVGVFKKVQKMFDEEEKWESWKESGCPTYEQSHTEDLKNILSERTNRLKERPSKYKNIKTRNLFKIDNAGAYDFNKFFDVNLNELKTIKVNVAYTESLNSENPFLGNYIERVLRDNDPQMEIEEAESIINTNETFSWKLLRLVSMNDISRLNNESKINTIIQDYADKYGKTGLEFSVKEPLSKEKEQVVTLPSVNASSNEVIVLIDREPSREAYKNAKDDQKLTRRKRSLDRNEKTYNDSYKKRKLE